MQVCSSGTVSNHSESHGGITDQLTAYDDSSSKFLPQPLDFNPSLFLGSAKHLQSIPEPNLGDLILLIVLIQSLALQVINIGTSHLPILVHGLVERIRVDQFGHPLFGGGGLGDIPVGPCEIWFAELGQSLLPLLALGCWGQLGCVEHIFEGAG